MVQQLLRHALVDEARRALLVLRVVPSAGPSAARSDPMGAGGADRAAAVGSVRRGGRLVEFRSSGGPLRAASRWACALAHALVWWRPDLSGTCQTPASGHPTQASRAPYLSRMGEPLWRNALACCERDRVGAYQQASQLNSPSAPSFRSRTICLKQYAKEAQLRPVNPARSSLRRT